MKTAPECIPCFISQALKAGKAAAASKAGQARILKAAAKLMAGHDMSVPPPYLGKAVQDIVKRVSKNPDPYGKIKKQYNKMALKLYPRLKREVARGRNKLLAAVKVAVTGNVIDFGLDWKFSLHREITHAFSHNPRIFDFALFEKTVSKAKNVLYIADNAGETVFDRVLIETMKGLYGVEVVYAVKAKPILNDTLAQDALYAGLDKCSRIISSGSGLPGTAPGKGTKEFLRIYASADIIISKGMGNYELLNKEKKPIFFLLKAKCGVVADMLGVGLGELVLKNGMK